MFPALNDVLGMFTEAVTVVAVPPAADEGHIEIGISKMGMEVVELSGLAPLLLLLLLLLLFTLFAAAFFFFEPPLFCFGSFVETRAIAWELGTSPAATA